MRIKLKDRDLGTWSLDRLTIGDAYVIKSSTGMNPGPIHEGLGEGDPASWQAVVWWLRRKTEPDLKLQDVDFAYGDLDVDEEDDDNNPPAEAPLSTSGESGTATSEPDATITSISSPAGAA